MIYDYEVTTGKGETLKLSEFKGKVILVVNTATGCGFTPQYEPIEKLYKDYHDQGLEILDIPCNQFGGQAPGTDDEIHEFCTLHYNTTFPQMKKADVNGENELPLYTYLKSQKGFAGFEEHEYKALLEKMFSDADPDWDKKPDIKWNFTKFIVDRSGNVVINLIDGIPSGFAKCGLARISYRDVTYFINERGEKAISVECTSATNFTDDGYAQCQDTSDSRVLKFFIIDTEGNILEGHTEIYIVE